MRNLVAEAHDDTRVSATNAELDEFVDRAELARRLGVHVRTIRRMVERGELPSPCLSAGGRPRWLWSYVLDYCHQRHKSAVTVDRRMRRKLN